MIDRYTRPEIAKIWLDQNKFQKMLDVEILATEALSRFGKVPKSALSNIKRLAKFDVERIKEIEIDTNHDVVAFILNLSENIGEDAKYIHMGLTSSDVLDTALSLQMKEAADILIDDLKKLLVVLKGKAKKYKYTPMMGRSHGVHAEPITFGLKMALFYDETKRNIVRLMRAKEIISVGKISGAVGTYANIDPRVEEYVCKHLGLRASNISTQILQRDRHAEYMTTLALIGSSLEKLSTEIRNLQRTEVAEVEEYFSDTQKGSSAMPHKKNPITCERIAGLARILRGNALASLESITLWHERDISHSSVERVVLPDSTILLDYMLYKLTEVVRKLVVYPENMIKNMEKSSGIIFSQRVLLELIDKGLTRVEAYNIVQKASMRSRDEHIGFKESLFGDEEVKKYLSRNEIEKCFDIQYHLKNVDKIFKKVGI